MPKSPALLYLDEDVSVLLGAILQARGFDILTTRDAEQLGQSDQAQLNFATTARRALFSHNRVDFENLHQQCLKKHTTHAGIIIARRRPPVELAARIGRLLTKLHATDIHNQLLYV